MAPDPGKEQSWPLQAPSFSKIASGGNGKVITAYPTAQNACQRTSTSLWSLMRIQLIFGCAAFAVSLTLAQLIRSKRKAKKHLQAGRTRERVCHIPLTPANQAKFFMTHLELFDTIFEPWKHLLLGPHAAHQTSWHNAESPCVKETPTPSRSRGNASLE